MLVGVICEGQTDYVVISRFITEELKKKGKDVKFKSLQPLDDCTLPSGWTKVLTWINNNPARARDLRYLQKGIFRGDEIYDALIFHLDTDLFDQDSFKNYLKNHSIKFEVHEDIEKRRMEMVSILSQCLNSSSLSIDSQEKHKFSVTVDSCENWCVAAIEDCHDADTVKGQNLIDIFGDFFRNELSLKKLDRHIRIDKNIEKRINFCSKVAGRNCIPVNSNSFRKTIEQFD